VEDHRPPVVSSHLQRVRPHGLQPLQPHRGARGQHSAASGDSSSGELDFGTGTPTFLFPTATNDDLGREQWGLGPAAIFGWKNKHTTVGIFPQYFFKIGSIDNQANKPDASFMNLLYFAYWNLPKAWQVGMNPVITYDNKATKGNKWNVPLGLLVTKTTAVGKRPVKFQFGFEYSVVSQDDFGKRFMIKFNVIPVIQGLVKNPIFGGN